VKSGSNRRCPTCQYYQETYWPRIQIVHQIDFPALVFREFNILGANSLWAAMCDMQAEELIGLGVEKMVHADSLASVVRGVKKLMLRQAGLSERCSLYLRNGRGERLNVQLSIVSLLEPTGAYLAIADGAHTGGEECTSGDGQRRRHPPPG
jgi:hypothetical protein